jgi:uncharacterized protein (TIGR00369 family)
VKDTIPNGFRLIERLGGFGSAFGPVYFNRETTTLGFRVTAYHVNQFETCHGGAIATFADMQIAAIVHSGQLSAAHHMPTINLSVDYIAPAPLGAWVEAAVMLIRTTRRLVFTQTLITVDGKTVARANASYRNHAAKSSETA